MEPLWALELWEPEWGLAVLLRWMLPSLGLPQGPGGQRTWVGRDWGWRPSVGRWELLVEAPGAVNGLFVH